MYFSDFYFKENLFCVRYSVSNYMDIKYNDQKMVCALDRTREYLAPKNNNNIYESNIRAGL